MNSQVDDVCRHVELDSAPVFMDLLHPLAQGGDAAQVFAWQEDAIRAESAEVSREIASDARPPPTVPTNTTSMGEEEGIPSKSDPSSMATHMANSIIST